MRMEFEFEWCDDLCTKRVAMSKILKKWNRREYEWNLIPQESSYTMNDNEPLVNKNETAASN